MGKSRRKAWRKVEPLHRAKDPRNYINYQERIALERAEMVTRICVCQARNGPNIKLELIIPVTNVELVHEGIKLQISEQLYINTNLAKQIVGDKGLHYLDYRDGYGNLYHFTPKADRHFRAIVENDILAHYNSGVFANPPYADAHNEARARRAVYDIRGQSGTIRVWAVRDFLGLHIILPEDY